MLRHFCFSFLLVFLLVGSFLSPICFFREYGVIHSCVRFLSVCAYSGFLGLVASSGGAGSAIGNPAALERGKSWGRKALAGNAGWLRIG